MVYVYVIRSEVDRHLYTGCSRDLKRRMKEHEAGKVPATRDRRPFSLIYYEACVDERDAFRRERYLKTAYGKRYIKTRCANYFTG